jgi:hypothetical protein
MPNWCLNKIVISNEDRKVIKRIIKAFNRGTLFNDFIPCPTNSRQLRSELMANPTSRKFADQGMPLWFAWRIVNWGTKWDSGQQHGTLKQVSPTKIVLDVGTANTPPLSMLDHWVSLGCKVRDEFWREPDCALEGTYDNGVLTLQPYRPRPIESWPTIGS